MTWLKFKHGALERQDNVTIILAPYCAFTLGCHLDNYFLYSRKENEYVPSHPISKHHKMKKKNKIL
jgi:hypothetical protein